jgi:hypothetical protein
MEKSTVDKLSSTILWAAGILAVSFIFSQSNTSPKVGRYTFTPERENWVLIGDTRTGRSWSCVAKALYEEGVRDNADFPKGFVGCHEMSVPSKVQKRAAYD